MDAALLELFRALATFEPVRRDLSRAPWEAYVDWAIAHGLGPLAAYNLEYRLGQCGAPQWARDRLLSVFQGTANDNVMKLVNFKQVVGGLEGRRVVLLGAASFADSLYPHVAFRPVGELRLFAASADVGPFASYLARGGFEADEGEVDPAGAERLLTDHRTSLAIHGSLGPSPALDGELLARAMPMKAYGPSIFRLELEDALLAQVVLMARCGFAVPMVEHLDVRELLLGAPAMGGPYSRPLRTEVLAERVAAWGAQRALWVALAIAERLFPPLASTVARARPALSAAVREVLERVVVGPAAEVGRGRLFRGEEAVRTLLVGG